MLGASSANAYDPRGPYLDFADRRSASRRRKRAIKLDEQGVPIVRYGETYHYNPVTTSQYGLQQWSLWLRGEATGAARERRPSRRRLVESQQPDGRWLYDFEFVIGGMGETLSPPWASAMAQGEAMSLLTRIHSETGDPRYLAAAQAALGPLRTSVADGGLAAQFEGHPFYEEYPTQTAPSLVLNGFIFCLFGLHDLGQTGSAEAAARYWAGFASLEQLLPHYDLDGWSVYHLGYLTKPGQSPKRATAFYHELHVMQLGFLQEVTPSPVLRHYRDHWAAYRPPASRSRSSAVLQQPGPALTRPSTAAGVRPPDRERPRVRAKLARRPRRGARALRLVVRSSEPVRLSFTLLRRSCRSCRARWSRPGGSAAGAGSAPLQVQLAQRLRPGRYRLIVQARDRAGNWTSRALRFTPRGRPARR